VNFPTKAKLARGRVVTPTRSLGLDPETLWTPERFEQEFPDIKTNGGGDGQANGAGTTDESNIPADTMKVIREGVEDGARSSAFWNVVKVLKEEAGRSLGSSPCSNAIPTASPASIAAASSARSNGYGPSSVADHNSLSRSPKNSPSNPSAQSLSPRSPTIRSRVFSR
jgi:hypothetical protein